VTALQERFAALWNATAAKLTGPDCFAYDPDRLTLRQHAAQGVVVMAFEPTSADGKAVVTIADPRWKDDTVPEDDSTFDVWPELRPHLPKDGRLRGFATVFNGSEDCHEVREIDLDTLALGPALTVLSFRT
jgi:hypothetical protein